MKKIWLSAIGLLAVIAFALPGCVCEAQNTPADHFSVESITGDLTLQSGVIFSQQQVGVWVNGEGEATAVPDIAVLTVGVETQRDTVDAARKEAAEAMSPTVISILCSTSARW